MASNVGGSETPQTLKLQISRSFSSVCRAIHFSMCVMTGVCNCASGVTPQPVLSGSFHCCDSCVAETQAVWLQAVCCGTTCRRHNKHARTQVHRLIQPSQWHAATCKRHQQGPSLKGLPGKHVAMQVSYSTISRQASMPKGRPVTASLPLGLARAFSIAA